MDKLKSPETQGSTFNSGSFDTMERSKQILDELMEELADLTMEGNFGGRVERHGMTSNGSSFHTMDMERSKRTLDDVMEALADPTIHIIGVYGSNRGIKDGLLLKVRRRIDRDRLFDVVVTASISDKPNVKSIQEQIAGQLGFHYTEKSEGRRASELAGRMKNEHRILVMLCNLSKGLDLGKVGISFGEDHKGCKLLLTSENEEVLSNQMHAQKIFML